MSSTTRRLRSLRFGQFNLVAALVLLSIALVSCASGRPLEVKSGCQADLVVDLVTRDQQGNEMLQADYVIRPGTQEHSVDPELGYVGFTIEGATVGESYLGPEELASEDKIPMPAIEIPTESCLALSTEESS